MAAREDTPSATSTGGPRSTPSGGDGSSGGDHRRVPIEILLTDVPSPGWHHVCYKKDVPRDACYVGCYGLWVTPGGMAALSRFTVTVLAVVKYHPGAGGKSHGQAVTTP